MPYKVTDHVDPSITDDEREDAKRRLVSFLYGLKRIPDREKPVPADANTQTATGAA
jgi:hypothetical protein